MNDRHRTSSVPRPTAATRAAAPTRAARRPASDRAAGSASEQQGGERTKFNDLTRPIARDRQLVKGRGKRLLIVGGAIVVAGALMASLFVLPVQAWYRQRDQIAAKQHQLSVLAEANAQLAGDVARLNTPDGIREAAREEIGVIAPGEHRVTVMPPPAAPRALPQGWPYDTVTQIIAVRARDAAAAAQAAAAAATATSASTATP